jgi:plastocyanin
LLRRTLITKEQTPVASKRRRKIWIIPPVVVIVLVVVVAAFYASSLSPTAPTAPSGPNVTIWNGTFCNGSGNCGFVPNIKNVTVGTTITWTTNGGMTHTVTTCDSHHSVSQCPGLDSSGLDSIDSSLAAGASYSHTFTVAGTYHYYCTPHPWMQGTIIVN